MGWEAIFFHIGYVQIGEIAPSEIFCRDHIVGYR